MHERKYINIFIQTLCNELNVTKVNFLAKFNRCGFRIFLLQDWLIHQGKKSQFVLFYTHNRRDNSMMNTFPKGYYRYIKGNSLVHPGFELGTLCSFPTIITVTLQFSPSICIFIGAHRSGGRGITVIVI